MALQFIFGNPGSGKSHYLYEHIIRESMKHPATNYIILVPEQFTMQTQKELVLRHPRHGIMNIDVLSFARLAFRVLEETGNGSREILDDEGKNLILRRLAGKKEDSLKVLKGNIKKPGYISEVKSVISELTQYNISPDGMDDMITEADESSYLAWKLKDIQVMYQAFEEYLADKYITKEEILDILCNVMDKSRMLKDSVIALDGFTGFTPLQNKVLGEMLHHCQKVMITVTMDKREDPYVMKDKYQLFALSKQMVTSLVKIAGEEKVLVEEPVCLYQEPVWRFRNAPALAFLEKELFRYSGRTYREKQSNVRVYAAANPRMEVECAAQRIRFLIRKKEYRYREIAVIASDMNLYADEIEKTFREYEIPVFMDYKRNVLLNSFVEYIRSLLAMAEQNFSAESVFRFLRTDLVGFTGEELDLLENYVLALGIRGYKKWQEKWIRRAKDTTEEELEVLNHLRVCFVEKTEELVFVLKQRQKTVRDVTLAICEFLEKEEIQKQERDVEKQYWEMVSLLVAVLNHNNLLEVEHQDDISFYTEQVYRQLQQRFPEYGITEEEIENVSHLAPIHDIGKIRVPIEILNKNGKLTADEMEIVKQHPLTGAEMTLRFPQGTTTEKLNKYSYEICRYHHERYDGSGYPDGLKGDEIPLCAQIVGLVDAYDALVSVRPYKRKLKHEEAIRMIANGECGVFSKKPLQCFIAAAMQKEWIKKADS